MNKVVPLHATAEVALSHLDDADPTLHALAKAVSDEPGWVVGGLLASMEDDVSDDTTRLSRAALLTAARREAEVFGDNYVRCEYLLLGALDVLGDDDRSAPPETALRRVLDLVA